MLVLKFGVTGSAVLEFPLGLCISAPHTTHSHETCGRRASDSVRVSGGDRPTTSLSKTGGAPGGWLIITMIAGLIRCLVYTAVTWAARPQ